MNYTIQNEFFAVTVAERGAELQSILGSDGTEYLWQGDPAYWNDRALNLFPYVARLTDSSYYLDGKLYRMDIHGFAPYYVFRGEKTASDRMVFTLTDSEKTYIQYPRHFVFRIVYMLRQNVLEIAYEIENRDEKTMYFGLGGHPGFNVPLTRGRSFEDYRLRFGRPCQPERVGFTKKCFLSGKNVAYPLTDGQSISLRHELFDEDAIVLKEMAHEVTLETDGDPRSITVTFPQMNYLGLWHWPKTDAPYICIEPWCSLPSEQDKVAVLEEQEDLISLEPNGHYFNRWSIRIGEK